jgi:hypothetical protein
MPILEAERSDGLLLQHDGEPSHFHKEMTYTHRLCGLVVRVPSYRCIGPDSIPGATIFFLRSSGSGTGSTQPRDDN